MTETGEQSTLLISKEPSAFPWLAIVVSPCFVLLTGPLISLNYCMAYASGVLTTTDLQKQRSLQFVGRRYNDITGNEIHLIEAIRYGFEDGISAAVIALVIQICVGVPVFWILHRFQLLQPLSAALVLLTVVSILAFLKIGSPILYSLAAFTQLIHDLIYAWALILGFCVLAFWVPSDFLHRLTGNRKQRVT
ncbi:hypothetical protein [Calycomorphotria hydatis]|uniref:Uncharacterized protein n=1 Tax=Calycomorphotria hydatis TaxID=2528027 RepID=A0A517TBX5_9PLAN|nr:hypothetical protein [Calycomorphotria hydatis]QDT65885.1 hypothetical protein V22_31480 [Calycomorphotria hydatis]